MRHDVAGAQARQAELAALMQQGRELEQEQKELQAALEKAGGEEAGEGTETSAEEREVRPMSHCFSGPCWQREAPAWHEDPASS